jgi:hypothetical protein
MKIDDDTLKRTYRGYGASRRPPNRKRCPSPAAIARSFEPSCSMRRKKRIVDHISECALCHDEFMIFLELKRSEALEDLVEDPTAVEHRRSGKEEARWLGRFPIWRYACIVLGIGLALSSYVLLVRQINPPGIVRTVASDIVLLHPKPDQKISSSVLFRWRRSPASEYYVVELFDEQLLPVWSSDIVHDPEIRLPGAVWSRLLSGRSYYWMVTGFAHESKAGESHLARFRIDR